MDTKQFEIHLNEIKDLKSRISKLEKENVKFKEELKNMIIYENSVMTEIANKIETKLDMFSNIEMNDNNKNSNKTVKKLTALNFLKQELKNDINKYLDILYISEDLNKILEKKEVKSKKSNVDKNNKIISLLYSDVIKKNSESIEKLNELLNEYLQDNEIKTNE